jgi:hypothetical protein
MFGPPVMGKAANFDAVVAGWRADGTTGAILHLQMFPAYGAWAVDGEVFCANAKARKPRT